ncbi:uncharacterized protein [Physcomitrium patens]
MKQNHENVERAESELNTLHEDMEQTLELQRRLAQRATGLEKEKKDIENLLQVRVLEFECERTALQNRIQNMGEDLRTKAEAQEKVNHLQVELSSTLEVKAQLEEQLSKIAEETFFLEKKADDYSRELQELLSKEQWDQKLDRMGRRAMTRRAFSNYQNGVREQCIDRANMVRAISKHKHTGCKKVFYLLRMATCRSCILRQLNVAQCQAAFCTSWEKWKLSMVSERNYRIYLEKQSKRAVTNAMQAWMAYILHVRLSPERYVMALNYWHQRCLQNCFRKWLQVLRFWKFPPKEEKVHMEKASRHHIKTSLCRYLVSWQGWLTTYARPKKLKFAVVQAHIDKMTMKQIVAAWRCMLHVKWVSRLKNDEATSFRKNWCLRRFSARWRQHTIEIKTFKLRNSQAMEYRAHRLKHLALQCWRNFMQHQMHMQIYKQMAFRQYLRSLAIMSIRTWRENVNYKKAQHKATTEVNQALTRAAMVFWRDYHVYKSIKKKQEFRAVTYRNRRQKKLAKVILKWWWERIAWKRKASQLDCLLTTRRCRTVLFQILHAWMHATVDGLLLANSKYQEDILEVQSQFQEQKHQLTTVDMENLQLIDRLHIISSEIAVLKTSVYDKKKLEKDLHRSLEDGTMLEISMRGEIEQKQSHNEELEFEIHSLKKKLQMKNAEDTAEEVHHTLELQNLKQALKDLRTQLVEKTSQVDSYAKALKETAERLEGASDESHEKLTSAFAIAGSLRKLLEDRESQFATLEGNCRRRELELEEVQRKLAVANCTLSETVESRDNRVRELESMLCNKQQEVQKVRQRLQDLEVSMDTKEGSVRRLEFELKLMTEQNALKSRTFGPSSTSLSATPQLYPDAGAHPQGGLYSLQINEFKSQFGDASTALQQQKLRQSARATSGAVGDAMMQTERSCNECAVQPLTTFAEDGQREDAPTGEGVVPGSVSGISDCVKSQPCQGTDAKHFLLNSSDSAEGVALQILPFQEAESLSSPHMGLSSGAQERVLVDSSSEMGLQLSEPVFLGQESRSAVLQQRGNISQPDQETAFALVSMTRPKTLGHITDQPGFMTDGSEPETQLQLERRGDVGSGGEGMSMQTLREGPYRIILDDDPNVVDSLHLEIQRLQDRIMSRLRDSTADVHDSSDPSGSGTTSSRPLPGADLSSGTSGFDK